jgi:hypothetical protein
LFTNPSGEAVHRVTGRTLERRQVRENYKDFRRPWLGSRNSNLKPNRFQVLAASLPAASHPPLAVCRYYNGRAGGL